MNGAFELVELLLCEPLERCLTVSRYLLDEAPVWLGE